MASHGAQAGGRGCEGIAGLCWCKSLGMAPGDMCVPGLARPWCHHPCLPLLAPGAKRGLHPHGLTQPWGAGEPGAGRIWVSRGDGSLSQATWRG